MTEVSKWRREGLFYVARFVHNHGCMEYEVTRRLDFVTYHLIRLIHGEAKLNRMAEK